MSRVTLKLSRPINQIGIDENELQANGFAKVIHCKDCRWYAYEYDGYHSECDLFKMSFDLDDYCSRAERKEDETD